MHQQQELVQDLEMLQQVAPILLQQELELDQVQEMPQLDLLHEQPIFQIFEKLIFS